jgi:plastocyanin
MTTYHKQISSNSSRLLAMVGGLLISVFVLGVRTQMVQSVFAAPAAPVKGGAKVSIANFAFTPGEITIAPGETVTWTNDDGAPHGLE